MLKNYRKRIDGVVGLGLVVLVLASVDAEHLAAQSLLGVEEAVRIAKENNHAVRLARVGVQIAANNATRGNAGFLPRLDLTAAYNASLSNARQEYSNGDVVERDASTSSALTTGLGVTWTAFDGFRMVAAYDRLREEERLAGADADLTEEEIVVRVIRSYYDVVLQQEILRVLRETADISQARLNNVQVKYDVGENSKRELLPARVDFNADRSAVLRQEVELQNAKAELNRLLARDPVVDFTVEDTIVVESGFELDRLSEEMMKGNRELALARIAVNVADLELDEAESQRYPRLVLNLGYNFSRSDAETGLVSSNTTNGLAYGAGASFNLFDGFNTSRQIENARVVIEAGELAYAETLNRVKTQLAQAYRNYRNRINLITLEQENLALARENLDIAMERLTVGSIIPLEMREAQNALVAAESRLLAAQYEAKLAETELLRVSGRLALTGR